MKVCPWCAEELSDEALVCTQCGRDPSSKPESPRPSRASASSIPGRVDLTQTDRPRTSPPLSPTHPQRTNTTAAAAIIIVALSYAASFAGPLFALIAELVGGGLGLVALRQIGSSGGAERGREIAVIAVVLAGLGVFGFVVAIVRGAALVG